MDLTLPLSVGEGGGGVYVFGRRLTVGGPVRISARFRADIAHVLARTESR